MRPLDFAHADLVHIRNALCELRERVLNDESLDAEKRRQKADDLAYLWGQVNDRLGEKPPPASEP